MAGRRIRGPSGWWGICGAVLLLVLGCQASGTEDTSQPLAATARFWMAEDDLAVISGAAVDAGVVCPEARVAHVGWDNADGESVTREEYSELVVEALETGEVSVGRVYREYRCDDGSGAFVIVERNLVSAGLWDLYGFNEDIATWEVHSGTGSYSGLAGQGSIDVDYDTRDWIVSGEFHIDPADESAFTGFDADSDLGCFGGATQPRTRHEGCRT